MIVIVDYGMGNLRSVQNAVEHVGGRVRVSSSAAVLEKADKIILPGVGSFGDAMRELKRFGLVGPIKEAIAGGRPFLGLCLGLQLLFEGSEEAPRARGLGVLKGRVKRFRFSARDLKIPHMGWNRIKIAKRFRSSALMRGVPDGSFMYFVHSYYVEPEERGVALTTTGYGRDFVSGVSKENAAAFQFHPEKSQKAGLKMLENFIRL